MMTSQILLVDDDEIQATTRCAILSRSGLQVTVAPNAQAALLLLDQPEMRASLRLLVTDHLMPGMNGPELVRRLRVILPTLPVVVLSGLNGAEADYEGLQISFQLKPFPPEELIRITNLLISKPTLNLA